MLIVLRSLEIDDEPLIRQLHDRLLNKQQADGSWKAFPDEEEGNLSATVEAYYALLYSAYSTETEERMRKARQYIRSKGGLRKIRGVMTKAVLAATGQYPWPASLTIPLEFLLLPSTFPVNFFDFSVYARLHITPVLLMADRKFAVRTDRSPDLSHLITTESEGSTNLFDSFVEPHRARKLVKLLDQIGEGIANLSGIPRELHDRAAKRAEAYMLERREADGTLCGYASCTFLMIYGLLALGYDKRHPVITRAVHGLKSMLCKSGGEVFVQNSPSAVWDTALLSHALQEAGIPADHGMIRRASAYLLSKQHRKPGDWSVHNPNTEPGGWGFSDNNTFNPDVDDTTAALRALKRLAKLDPACRPAWNRGLNWILSMQNRDGGWPAFEKDTDNEWLALLPMDGARSAAIDPSAADLTGRTLEYLGNSAGFETRQPFIRRGVEWLIRKQETNGSWYGRWGICYIYGTWAAITGMTAVGAGSDHGAVRKGASWLLNIQNPDSGWGESCRSDRDMRYVPLGASTPSQTAWALDALIAANPKPISEIKNGLKRLIEMMHENDWRTIYPTGAGLPGTFYVHYHSYRYIWPLLTLSNYRKKYGDHT